MSGRQPRRSGKSKRRSQAVHARRRALERFGVEFSQRDMDELVRCIQNGQGTFVRRSSNRVTVWDLPRGDETLRVVYDKARKQVVTVLYADL